jgi:2-polyprenyl-3-methyl-5-hydroxy-6-metoxy-1,4-benzoquinol methylase
MIKNNLIQPMPNNDQFKSENLQHWKENTEYWLSAPLRHVTDNTDFMKGLVNRLVNNDMTVIDMGCGDAFLYSLIREKWPQAKYIGLDFNELFISDLQSKHADNSNAQFIVVDLEKNIPKELLRSADVIFNFFNFFELTHFSVAFENAVKMLKTGGKLSIQTIEYTYLLLAISAGMEQFKFNLREYEKIKLTGKTPYIFQKIDLGSSDSKSLSYGSVFYSTADFLTEAINCKLELLKFSENIKTSKFHPKVYQYFEFQKKTSV